MKYKELLRALQNLIDDEISQTNIAEILGCTPQKINKRALRNSKFSKDEIATIGKHYNVDLSKKATNFDNFVDIPVRGEVYASMGTGMTVYNEQQTGTYKISTELARDLGVNIARTEMIIARGDSMMPSISGGDSLLVDLSKREIHDGSIYCVRIDDQLYAKRLQKIPPSSIKVISDNEKYDAFYVDFSKEDVGDFEIIGEVRWAGRVFR